MLSFAKKVFLFVWKTGLFPYLSEFWKCNFKAVMKANKMYLMILASVHKWTIVSHSQAVEYLNSHILGYTNK